MHTKIQGSSQKNLFSLQGHVLSTFCQGSDPEENDFCPPFVISELKKGKLLKKMLSKYWPALSTTARFRGCWVRKISAGQSALPWKLNEFFFTWAMMARQPRSAASWGAGGWAGVSWLAWGFAWEFKNTNWIAAHDENDQWWKRKTQ